jgi:hypothetical protein
VIAELPEYGCELDGYYFGTPDLSPFLVQDISYDQGDIITNDTPNPRADGMRFGRDFHGGQIITFKITGLDSPGPDQMAAYSELRAAWRASQVRAQSGQVCTLRMGRAGRTRRVYGRPRRFSPTLGEDSMGNTFVTCDFQAVDGVFYGDGELSNTLTITPPAPGGFLFPATFPWGSVGISYAPGVVKIKGDEPAWMVFMIRGPITRPKIRVVGHWSIGLNLILQAGEWVGIDARPWSRGIRTNTGANLGGTLLPGSPSLSQVKLDPDTYEIVLTGQDETGTASFTTAWRETWVSP